jgi:hypothetical protein
MLEIVGIPVAINPDRRLADVAYTRGWPVVEFARPHHRLVQRLRIALVLAVGFVVGRLSRRQVLVADARTQMGASGFAEGEYAWARWDWFRHA